MRFSLSRLWSSPIRQVPELVHETESDDDDDVDDPLNTPLSSYKRLYPQRKACNATQQSVRVVDSTPISSKDTFLHEDSPFIDRNIHEAAQKPPSAGWNYRERPYVATVEDLTETLKQVSEESKGYQEKLDEERKSNKLEMARVLKQVSEESKGYQEKLDEERKSNKLEMARVKRQLEDETRELEAVKACLLEERMRRQAVQAEIERLRVLLHDEKTAHRETKAELGVVRLQLDHARAGGEKVDEDDSNLRGYFYRSASEVFAAKEPMGSGRKETFCLYNGSVYRTRPDFDDVLSRLTKPYVLYSGHERRVPQLESTIKKLPTCTSANKHHFFDMRGTNGYKRHYKCNSCGFFEREPQ